MFDIYPVEMLHIFDIKIILMILRKTEGNECEICEIKKVDFDRKFEIERRIKYNNNHA